MPTINSVNNKFQYCTLKYRHSIFLNENVNVGLLFFFQEEKRLEFIYPKSLTRISHLYSNINIGIIAAGLISEKFKLGWKNGTTNLIAPIGLDLIEPDSIKQKALTWFGKLSFLNSYAKSHNTEFHLLISKPTGRNLINSFNKAVKVIQEADAPIKIYTDTQIDEYSTYVSENLTGYIS